MLFRTVLAALALLLFVNAVGAEKRRSTPAERESIALTIYNSNLGLVKETRNIEIGRGTSDLWFEGVAAQIDPTSVHIRSIDHPEALRILEQNFEYDLISPAKLMEKYVGHEVELVRSNQGAEERLSARLVGTTGGHVYEIDGKIAIDPPYRVVLPSLPEGLISKPSLVWLLDSDRQTHRVEASYLTGGVTWRANYVAVLDKDDAHVDLGGWITIDNRSGATYENATLKLVAGDINRVGSPRDKRIMAMADAPIEHVQEESFFEYHLYTVARPTTVRDNQTKQIALLSAEGAGVEKSFVYTPSYPYFSRRMDGPETSTKVGVFISLDNSDENGMGIPLPGGVVRVYKQDASGALQFVGEDRIGHTPVDETIRIRMGNAFDIVAERVQTDFEVLSGEKLHRSSYEVSIRNHKEEDVVVSVVERLTGDWKVTKHSPRLRQGVVHPNSLRCAGAGRGQFGVDVHRRDTILAMSTGPIPRGPVPRARRGTLGKHGCVSGKWAARRRPDGPGGGESRRPGPGRSPIPFACDASTGASRG